MERSGNLELSAVPDRQSEVHRPQAARPGRFGTVYAESDQASGPRPAAAAWDRMAIDRHTDDCQRCRRRPHRRQRASRRICVWSCRNDDRRACSPLHWSLRTDEVRRQTRGLMQAYACFRDMKRPTTLVGADSEWYRYERPKWQAVAARPLLYHEPKSAGSTLMERQRSRPLRAYFG